MSIELATEFLKSLGIFAVVGSLILSILIAVLGVFPSLFVTSANVIIWGPYFGFFISWVGEIIGAWVSFLLYRKGFKSRFEKISGKYALFRRITNSKGSKTGLLIFQARLIPFIPSGLVTFAAAISNVSLSTFLISSAVGKFPSIVLETMVSYDILNLNQHWFRLLLILISVTTMVIIFKKRDI